MGVTVRQKQPEKGKPWWVFINHQGKRKAKLVGDKKAAEKLASLIREKLKKNELKIEDAGVPTFEEYATEWLEGYVKTSLKDTTYCGYEISLRVHIFPLVGKKRLNEVSRPDVKNLIFEMLKKNYAASTVRNMKACISGVLSNAVEDEIIAMNPASRTGKFIKKKPDEADLSTPGAINFLTREEVNHLLEIVLTHFPRHYPLLLCAVRTGMRIGEIAGLEWGDIDFNSRFIEVKRAIVKGKVTTTKNGKTRRIDMSQQLSETLKVLKLQRKKEALQKGTNQIPKHVFLMESGATIEAHNFKQRIFAKCLEKAGMRQIRVHDLRHTFASLLIAQRESLAYIRDQLGHSSIRVTVDTYGHLVPGSNKIAVDKLDDFDATGCNLCATNEASEGIGNV